MNELHHQHRLADPGAAEHRGLAALRQRREKIDHLDASGEQLGRASLRRECWRLAMNGPARRLSRQRGAAVADTAEHIEQPPEGRFADSDGNRPPGGPGHVATPQARRRFERDRARAMRIEMRLDLGDHHAAVAVDDLDRVLDRRRLAVEGKVDHRAANRDHTPVKLPCGRHRKALLTGAIAFATRRARRQSMKNDPRLLTFRQFPLCEITSRAKEGSSDSVGERFAPTLGAIKKERQRPASISGPRSPQAPEREWPPFAQCENK